MDTTSIGHNYDPHLLSNSGEKKRKSRRGCRAGVGRKKPRLVATTTTVPSSSSFTAIHHVDEPVVAMQSSHNIHTTVPPYTSAAAEAAAAAVVVNASSTSKPTDITTIIDTNTNIGMTTVSERLLTRHVKSVKRSVRIDSASQVYNTQDLPSSLPSQNHHSQERSQNYDRDDDVREENDENKMVVNDSQVSNVSVRGDENNGFRSAIRTEDIARAAGVDAVGDKPNSQQDFKDIPQVLLLLYIPFLALSFRPYFCLRYIKRPTPACDPGPAW